MTCWYPSIDRWRKVMTAASILVLALGMASFARQVHADELSDVQRLYYAGQTDAAMSRADKFLIAKPADPQMRFMKGVMLADAGRNAEATTVFAKLTEDHPDLVEPYNNLAALYAAAGDYAQARSTLEQALRANPGYSTAHENLGDVYVAMAAQSYVRALQLAPANTTLAPKLALVRQVLKPSATASLGAASAGAGSGAGPGAAASNSTRASRAPVTGVDE